MMTATLQQCVPCVAPPAESNTRKPASRGAKDRKRVEELLPHSVIDELRTRSAQAACIDTGLVRDLDADLAIEARYGVTRRRLGTYLRRLHHGSDSPADREARLDDRDAADPSSAEIHAHRVRQASVASILDATFGSLAETSPELWDRRAYLMLVGLVYERLATSKTEIPTGELVALAKVLVDGRRADARTREATRSEESQGSQSASDAPLPGHFSRIIRQVYGANLQDPTGDLDNPASEDNHAADIATKKPLKRDS